MKTSLKLCNITILTLCFLALASCGILDKRAAQRETREGLEAIVAQELPELEAFEQVKVVSFDDSRTEYGITCYYATDYLIMGTRLSEKEALEHYREGLLPLGWTDSGTQYPSSNKLYYGQNARIVFWYGDPGVNIRDAVDYDQLKKFYQSIMFVRVDYIQPAREGC